MAQAAAFIADWYKGGIFCADGFQSLPGVVGRTAVDDNDFGRSESLPHQAVNKSVDTIALVEHRARHGYGRHGGRCSRRTGFIRQQFTRGRQISVGSSQLPVTSR